MDQILATFGGKGNGAVSKPSNGFNTKATTDLEKLVAAMNEQKVFTFHSCQLILAAC